MHHVFADIIWHFFCRLYLRDCKNGILSVSSWTRLFNLPILAFWSVCMSPLSNSQSFCLLTRCFAFNAVFCLFFSRLLVLPPFIPSFYLSASLSAYRVNVCKPYLCLSIHSSGSAVCLSCLLIAGLSTFHSSVCQPILYFCRCRCDG